MAALLAHWLEISGKIFAVELFGINVAGFSDPHLDSLDMADAPLKQAAEIAREVLGLTDSERELAVKAACGGDAELLQAVRELLAAGAVVPDDALQATGDFQSPLQDDASYQTIASQAATGAYTPLNPAKTVIADRYVLQRKVGEGGMGEVWVAQQIKPVKRDVAVKLIKPGMDSQAVLARFEQERQALAIMDHPNIARVLDGGITPSGRPFFVMELVKGLPLNSFCDQAKLDLNERLELFVPICQAIQHAHQKGIVHRDLKPANILVSMVDGRPMPKVIDFGVAKAISGRLTDQSMETQFGAIVGTLEYMSPEQAGLSDGDVDTRADIYSLGVTLYELLTGMRPIDASRLKSAAFSEMLRIIKEEEPSKPSTRISTSDSLPSVAAVRKIHPERLKSILRGELDWVVMKCLEKQRDRRYETANALARDIQRYLADEAVEARPPSSSYRLRKFVRRNTGAVAATVIVLASLVLGTIGTAAGML
jgi:eukaryotic-like serine/threonine-protein kinase